MWQSPAYSALNTRLDRILGDRTAKLFDPLRIRTAGDLLRHLPRRYLRGAEDSQLADLRVGEDAAFIAIVEDVKRRGDQRSGRVEVIVGDGRARIRLTFFGKAHLLGYWTTMLAEGARGLFAGKVGIFNHMLQLTHPDFVLLSPDGHIIGGAKRNQQMGELASQSGLIGLYPATAKLPTWTIAQCIDRVREHCGELPDPLPAGVLDQVDVLALARGDQALEDEPPTGTRLPDLATAIAWVHRPSDLRQAWLGRQRMLFDEAFTVQATMAHRRAQARLQPAVSRVRRDDGLLAALDSRLPFRLTAGQESVSNEIFEGLAQTHPMQRLLQGEVGSGKTLVALRAMLVVVDSGGQAALMAPTEVLAQQHYQTIVEQLGELAQGGLLGGETATTVTLLSGSMPAAAKRAALDQIASGEAGIVIGTHALLGDRVEFAALGLVVVDEQHRFGVEQRAVLNEKAAVRPHVLVMTATPIPRSVAMTVFGDLEVSTLTEIPAGRSPVTTTVVREATNPNWVDRAWQRVVEEAEQGRQSFIVCSQITPTEASGGSGTDLGAGVVPRNVTDLHADLIQGPLADVRVEMLHGQMPTEAKDDVMTRFASGSVDVLIATTVIEVGVNVPNASMMVVSDADRFGISQLHQLRGRIGRGAHPGLCLLMTRTAGDDGAAERLTAVASTRDGFILAEADLAQRQEGDVLGAAQAGARSSLRLLRVLEHAVIIEQARAIAEACVLKDPELTDPGLADAVQQVTDTAAAEWLERN